MATTSLVQSSGSESDSHGRYLVASRDIRCGETVLNEAAFLKGPRISSVLVCVQCLQKLPSLAECSICGLSLCYSCNSTTVSDATSDHRLECQLLKNNNVKLNSKNENSAKLNLNLVTILRLLLISQDKWNHLQSNKEQRRGGKEWMIVNKMSVPVLGKLKDQNGNILFTEEEIQQAAGVIDTNSFELKNESQYGRVLFLKGSFFNSSCVPNCLRQVKNGRLEVTAVRDVKVGEELNICYVDLLQPTFVRQKIFWERKFFRCNCQRCRDPTELGTFPTCYLCIHCEDSLREQTCIRCSKVYSKEDQLELQRKTNSVLRSLSLASCESKEAHMKELGKLLSKHHHLLVKAKQMLVKHAESCRQCRHGNIYQHCIQELQELRSSLLPAGQGIIWEPGGPLK